MKSLTLISTGTLCVAMMACSTAANAPAGTAGASGSGPSGGAAPAGGGAPAGGDATAGGAGPVGGAGPTGGTGGDTTATAGTGAGGDSTAGAGGSTAGSGGGAVVGGAGGAAAGSGNVAGGGSIDATMFGAGWDGALLEYPCASKGATVDCPNVSTCDPKVWGTSAPSSIIPPVRPVNQTPQPWTVGGTAGVTYDVHVLIRGVVEAYNYVGGTIDKTSGTPATRLDLFGEDGVPQSNLSKVNGSDYNTYILTVTPPTGPAKNYNLNAVPNAENPHTSTNLTQHRSFEITEDKHIMIPGGSKVSLAVGDSNCVEIMNCGNQAGGSCTNPWSVPLTGSTPAIPVLPATFSQPFSANGSFGQWVAFDVLDVTVAK